MYRRTAPPLRLKGYSSSRLTPCGENHSSGLRVSGRAGRNPDYMVFEQLRGVSTVLQVLIRWALGGKLS